MREQKLNDKLGRFSSQIAAQSGSQSESKYPENYKLLATEVGGELQFRNSGSYCLSKKIFSFNYVHGSVVLDSAGTKDCLPIAAFSHNVQSIDLDISSMLFLDTETTGLGGSGAVAFLVGIGKVTQEGFEVSQYLIPDYSDEAAMLEDINAVLTGNSTIVSFNGASFDLPVLQDRMIINRISRKIEYGYHLDLLHPARRLFKRRLSDCTLVNLERQLFSFYRSDDIPGYLVPSVYFDWLSSQELSKMNGVMEHNRLDILSMYFLMTIIAEAYRSNGGTLNHTEDLYSLSRYFERRKENNKIESVYEKILNENGQMSTEASLHFARNFKRNQKFEKSVGIWEKIAAEKSPKNIWACIELAKYYEHVRRDFTLALEYTHLARKIELFSPKQLSGIEKRIQRLNRKLIKTAEN